MVRGGIHFARVKSMGIGEKRNFDGKPQFFLILGIHACSLFLLVNI